MQEEQTNRFSLEQREKINLKLRCLLISCSLLLCLILFNSLMIDRTTENEVDTEENCADCDNQVNKALGEAKGKKQNERVVYRFETDLIFSEILSKNLKATLEKDEQTISELSQEQTSHSTKIAHFDQIEEIEDSEKEKEKEEKETSQMNNLLTNLKNLEMIEEESKPEVLQTSFKIEKADLKLKEKVPQQITKLKNILHSSLAKIAAPKSYRNISSISSYKELPFCLLSHNEDRTNDFLTSFTYTNYKYYVLPQTIVYQDLLKIIKQKCQSDSIVLIFDNFQRQRILQELNLLYQTKNAWLTYHQINSEVSVSSFYVSIFYSLELNDFKNTKERLLQSSLSILVTSLLELGNSHAQKLSQPIVSSPLKTTLVELQETYTNYEPYQAMYSLSQNYFINEGQFLKNINLLRKAPPNLVIQEEITIEKIQQAIEYLELKSLPINHSLYDRERKYFQTRYHLSQFEQKTQFCVIVPSFNNTEWERYKKVMKTILYQEYQNYHIVFIDDFSSDQTLFKTKQYLESEDFQRVSYVRNDKKRYATYNLKNAAENYCKEHEVMLIVDGDDELVGTQVFKLINSQYQSHPQNWIVYTNFFNSEMKLGTSKKLHLDFFTEKRTMKHMLAPVRTFYRELFLQIQDRDHRDEFGMYFDTAYDQAMQFPMIEMAGMRRVQYIPQVCYFYNLYSNNDGSTEEKMIHRKKVKDNLLERSRYSSIDYLFADNFSQQYRKQTQFRKVWMNISVKQREGMINLKQRILQIIENAPETPFYLTIPELTNSKALPFCIISLNSTTQKSLIASIQYENYNLVPYQDDQKSTNMFSYLEKKIQSKCRPTDIIVISDGKLQPGSLYTLNQTYQRQDIWLTYHQNSNLDIGISSFYAKVFLNLLSNDFLVQKQQLLLEERNFVLLSMFQLGRIHLGKFASSLVFTNPFLNPLSFDYSQKSNLKQGIRPYQSLYSLTQSQIDEQSMSKNYEIAIQNAQTKPEHLLSLQYLQIPSLPTNHSLSLHQKYYYSKKYNLQQAFKELPLCIIIISHNNEHNNRYKKNIQSILRQEYQNYHIVFVDDGSTDRTLEISKQLIENDKKATQLRTIYFQNKERKFISQNVRWAAQNFCARKEVMVVLDGQGELITNQVFKLINSNYLRKDIWALSANYIDFSLGTGFDFEINDIEKESGKNKFIVGPLMTFYVDLFLNIKQIPDLQNLKNSPLLNLATIFQGPLLTMSTSFHSQFFSQFLCICSSSTTIVQSTQKSEQLIKQNPQLFWSYTELKQLFIE